MPLTGSEEESLIGKCTLGGKEFDHKDDENGEEKVVVQGGKVKWYLHNCMGLGR